MILNGPDAICGWMETSGLSCRTVVFQLNIWNVLSFVLIATLISVAVHFVRRYRSLDTHDMVMNLRAPFGAISTPHTMQMHPHTLAQLLKLKGYDELGYRDAARKLNSKLKKQFFVVQMQEGGREVLRTELNLLVPWRGMDPDCFRVDPVTLARLKKGTESKQDDDTDNSVGADGIFDIFVRPVRPWDFRHWLFHPNREIRIALYVAIFAASLEYSSQIFELLRWMMSAPPS